MALADSAKMIAALFLDTKNFDKGVKGSLGSLGKLEKGVGRVGKGAGQVSAGLARSGAIIGAAVGGGLLAAAKAGADFEAQLNTINTVAGASTEELKAIGDGIRALSRETGATTGDLTTAYYDLVSAGIATADAQGVLTAANRLAIGGLATTAETVDLLTTAINSYGGDASKATEYANMFAQAIAAGKVTAAEIAASFANVGPLAAQVGIGVDEISAALGVMTAKGTPAAEVFTQMRAAIKLLQKPTKDLKSLINETGNDYEKIAKKKGIVAAFQQMEIDAKEAGTSVLALSGRMEAALFSAAVTGDTFEDYNKQLELVRGSSEGVGVAAEQMAQRQKGLTFEVNRLKANLVDAGLTLSEGFLPALARSTGKLTKFLGASENQEALKNLGKDIGAAIDDIDWKAVLDGGREFVDVMKIAFGWAKRIFDVVNMLPTEIKAAAAGFLALNKLSGGLVGAGVGNIVGGLSETIIRSLGSQLPGIAGKAFVQPVMVTNWPVGGLGGAAGAAGGTGKLGFLGAAVSLSVAGAIVAAAVPIGQAFAAALPKELKGEGGKGMSESQTRILQGLKEESAKTSKTPEKITALGVSFGRQSAEVKSAVERAKDAAMETKRETARGTGIVTSAVDRSAATIRNGFSLIPPPMVSVNVAVSPTTINRVTNVTNRYGTTSGDRHSNSTGSGTLGNGGR
jgi:TP901 family phage tail tape measure protein